MEMAGSVIENKSTISLTSEARGQVQELGDGYTSRNKPYVQIKKTDNKCEKVALSDFDGDWDEDQIPLLMKMLQETIDNL